MVVGLLFLLGVPACSTWLITRISQVKCDSYSLSPLITSLFASFPLEANIRQTLQLLREQIVASLRSPLVQVAFLFLFFTCTFLTTGCRAIVPANFAVVITCSVGGFAVTRFVFGCVLAVLNIGF